MEDSIYYEHDEADDHCSVNSTDAGLPDVRIHTLKCTACPLITTQQLPREDVEFCIDGYAQPVPWSWMVPFWAAYRTWLSARGYHLYELCDFGLGALNWAPPSETTEAPLPYARCASDDVLINPPLTPPVSRGTFI